MRWRALGEGLEWGCTGGIDYENSLKGEDSILLSAAWTEKPATGQLNCWLDGCLPENGLLARYRARAQSMLQTAGGAYKIPKVAEILWANADAEFAGAVRFDTDRSPSAAHVSGYERLTESEIGKRLGEANRIARGLARGPTPSPALVCSDLIPRPPTSRRQF